MGRITKFDINVQSRILELASLGYSITHIAKLLQVSRNTLHRWINNYDLKRQMDEIEEELMRSTIKRGLIALAEGVKLEEEQIKFIEEDDAGRPVEITKRTKVLPPSEKAIQILASHYDKRFGGALDYDSKHKHLTHDININVMNQRELIALRQANPLGDIEAVCHEVDAYIPKDASYIPEDAELASDILEEESESTPPTKDLDHGEG